MEHCRLQIGCLIVLLYVGYVYLRECRKFQKKLENTAFDELLLLGIFSIVTDGATAYTVNHLDTVPPMVNTVLHAAFLVGLDLVIFALFLNTIWISQLYDSKTYWGFFISRIPQELGMGAVKLIFIPILVPIARQLRKLGLVRYVDRTKVQVVKEEDAQE